MAADEETGHRNRRRHPQVNGVVRTLAKCCELMTERGYEVIVISPQDYRSVPCPTYPEIRLAMTTPSAFRRRLVKLQPDYVHIATEGPLGFMARRACLKMGWSFTTSFHTRFPEYLQDRFPIPPKWTYAFLRRFHNAASHTLVPTQSILDDLHGRGFTGLELWTRGVDRTLFIHATMLKGLAAAGLYLRRARRYRKEPASILELKLPGTKLIVGDGPALDDLKTVFRKPFSLARKRAKTSRVSMHRRMCLCFQAEPTRLASFCWKPFRRACLWRHFPYRDHPMLWAQQERGFCPKICMKHALRHLKCQPLTPLKCSSLSHGKPVRTSSKTFCRQRRVSHNLSAEPRINPRQSPLADKPAPRHSAVPDHGRVPITADRPDQRHRLSVQAKRQAPCQAMYQPYSQP